MKSNVLPNDDDASEWASEGAVEDALRRLPAPGAPPGLEARLIAAIPATGIERSSIPPLSASHGLPPCARSPLATVLGCSHPFKGGGSWAAWASVAAAIVVLAAIVAWQGDRDVADGLPRGDGDERQGTENSVFVVTKETDPCNILPPIPDWL